MSIQSHESSFSDIQGLPPLETVDFVAQAESLIQENQETADRRRARLIDYLVKDIGGYTLEQGEAIVSRLAIEKNPGWPLYDKGAWSELWHRWKELAPNRAATGNISSQFGRIRIPASRRMRETAQCSLEHPFTLTASALCRRRTRSDGKSSVR